jgi:leader peptidase (prepilin peptidase)/N-methyltransferase
MSVIAGFMIIFGLGLCLGSFASLLAWRWPRDLPWVKTRSQCPVCGHVLGARDLIPVVSWLMARGMCRHCATPVSPIYPALEIISALICVALFSLIGWHWELAPALMVVPIIVAGVLIFLRRNS